MCVAAPRCTRRLKIQSCFFYYLSVPVAPPVIKMQAPKRVILTWNESLSLTCNTTNVNGDIKLKWVTPPGSVRPFCLFLAMCCAVGGIFNWKKTHIAHWVLTVVLDFDLSKLIFESTTEYEISSRQIVDWNVMTPNDNYLPSVLIVVWT